jgi:hypothetical protein
MENELLEIRDYLESRKDLKIDLRGSGKSTFLYVRSHGHAAEVSIDTGGIFVEYWDHSDEESDMAAIRSEIVESIPEVVRRLTEWL